MKKISTRPEIKAFPEINWGVSSPSANELFLKWGEVPFSVPQQVCDDIATSLSTLNRYPTIMEELRQELAKYTELSVQNICLTNGSDKAFRLLAEAYITVDDELITFTPSYPVIDSAVMLMGGKIVQLPLTQTFCLPAVTEIRRAIQKRTKLIYICNPNNPTGNIVSTLEKIEEILKLGILVVVDEAYFEISNNTVLPLLKEYQNLIVLRTFSKGFSLAGLRVGYILANPFVIQQLRKIEQTLEIFNIATPSLVGSISALRNRELFLPLLRQLKLLKKNLQSALSVLGFEVFDSQTTFLLFDTKKAGVTAKEFCESMKQEKILLKDCSIYSGLDEWKVYTAIPAEKDVEKFITATKKVLRKHLR